MKKISDAAVANEIKLQRIAEATFNRFKKEDLTVQETKKVNRLVNAMIYQKAKLNSY